MRVKVLIPVCLTLLASSLFVACSSYDDTDIKNQIEELDSRVSKLEAIVSQMNTNISSYLKTVEALESGDRILSVTPLEDGTGYTITFSKTGTITIYNGKDGEDGNDGNDGNDGAPGKDGSTPEIGVKLDADGTYYWTVNGEYLLDNNGNKIAATAHISTPQVQLSADGKHYEISFDNGATWMTVGDVAGTGGGDTVFTGVNDGTDEVTFYLTDGTTIIIPKVQLFGLNIANTSIGISAGQTVSIAYTVTAADEGTIVDGIGNNGYSVVVESTSASEGVIKVTAPTPLVDGKAIIMAVNSKGTTSGKILTFEAGYVSVDSDAVPAVIPVEGGSFNVSIKTNLAYDIVLTPTEAASWISHEKSSTKASVEETITFVVSANTGAARTATIQIVDAADATIVYKEIIFVQSAAEEDGYHSLIDDWETGVTITF